MILGEPQILGQLKDAFRDAQVAGTLGNQLGRLMQHTFAVAKKIRTDTKIGASPVSPFQGSIPEAIQFTQGGAALCPGLVCSGPFGAKRSRREPL